MAERDSEASGYEQPRGFFSYAREDADLVKLIAGLRTRTANRRLARGPALCRRRGEAEGRPNASPRDRGKVYCYEGIH
jgi:hypothetical protein